MKDQIEKLKQELREFLELSKGITPEKWHVIEPFGAFDCAGIEAGYKSVVVIGIKNEDDAGVRTGINDAAFIARSRNISPAMAECLLVAVNGLDRLYDDTEGCADGAPDATDHDKLCNEVAHTVKFQLQQILTLWEASK